MLRLGLSVLIVALLAGCATPPTPYAFRSRYYGVPVDSFFLEWGAPVAKHKVPDGTMAYLWFARRDSAYDIGHTDSELIGNTAWWKGYSIKDYMTNLECGVRIYTYHDTTIRAVLLRDANKGWYEDLRCREVFGPPLEWDY